MLAVCHFLSLSHPVSVCTEPVEHSNNPETGILPEQIACVEKRDLDPLTRITACSHISTLANISASTVHVLGVDIGHIVVPSSPRHKD